jgi:hypothetical protein
MASRHRTPTRKDYEQFCATEGWERRKRATGKRGTHHVNYELALPDGRVLFTRISHPVDRTDYGGSIWSHILRDQLQVNEDEFWACVDSGVAPDRGGHEVPPEAIPVAVVRTLVRDARIPEAEVRAMSKEQAVARLAEFYTSGR